MCLNNSQAARVVEKGARECAGGKGTGYLARSPWAHGPWRRLRCGLLRGTRATEGLCVEERWDLTHVFKKSFTEI